MNPQNGIQMDIWSNQAGAQFYTSNFLNLTKTSNGHKYNIHEGFCIETSNYPNAINQVKKRLLYVLNYNSIIIFIYLKPLFPSSVLKKEGKYNHRTVYQFQTIN
jgi:aldose 1-epimerase